MSLCICRLCHLYHCRESDGSHPDTILYDLECLVDNVLQLGQRDSRLMETHKRLVSLYEHWTVLQSHLPPCTVLAVGVDCRSVNTSVCTGHRGRPPVFLNLNMVESLRNAGFTWSEVARALLVSRTTIWRKWQEVGITMEKYSDVNIGTSVRSLM